MIDFGEFLNPFVVDLRVFAPVSLSVVIVLAIFSVLYNHWMNQLGDKKEGYLSLLVALGNGVTLLILAVLSWKAAMLGLLGFVVSGVAMIAGDMQRSQIKREQVVRHVRRKALPYAASALIDDGRGLLVESQRVIKKMLAGSVEIGKLGLVGMQISEAINKLSEALKVEGE